MRPSFRADPEILGSAAGDLSKVWGHHPETDLLARVPVQGIGVVRQRLPAQGRVGRIERLGGIQGIEGIERIGRLEGLEQIEQIISQYESDLPLPRDEIRKYLTDNITFHVDGTLEQGMRLYFELAQKHGLIADNKPLRFIGS